MFLNTPKIGPIHFCYKYFAIRLVLAFNNENQSVKNNFLY